MMKYEFRKSFIKIMLDFLVALLFVIAVFYISTITSRSVIKSEIKKKYLIDDGE